MPINLHVCKPKRIRDLAELEDILKRMEIYREEYAPHANEIGVLMIQSRQFGAIYRIESRDNAEKEIDKPVFDDGNGNRTCEWGVKFYPPSYFEKLRETLSSNRQENYS